MRLGRARPQLTAAASPAAAVVRGSALVTPAVRRHLDRLREAEADRERVAEEITAAELHAKAARERVAAAYRRGEVPLEAAEERTATIDIEAEKAGRRGALVDDAIAGLRADGAEAVRERETELDAALADEDAEAAAEVARLAAELARWKQRRQRLGEQRAAVRAEAREVMALFDHNLARRLREEELERARLVRWAVEQGGTRFALAQVPEELHPAVAEQLAARRTRDAQAAEAFRKNVEQGDGRTLYLGER